MKQALIYSSALAMMVMVAPSHADNWEWQKHRQDMMMESTVQMHSDGSMQHRQANVEQNRRKALERSQVRNIDDIERLPATAAGYPGDRNMEKDGRQDMRRGHRGEIEYDY